MELRHKGALKILGTEWKLVCLKCSSEEEEVNWQVSKGETRDANKPGSGWAV